MSDDPNKIRMNLPLEIWLDIFAHIPRRRLANRVATIGRHFAAIAEIWLNDGKITLRPLYIDSLPALPKGRRRLILWNKSAEQIVPFPRDVPKPPNIVDFEEIEFGAFIEGLTGRIGPDVRGMLENMKPMLSNVSIHYRVGHLLINMLPLFGAIKCVRCTITMPVFSGHLAKISILNLEMLNSLQITTMDWLLNRGQLAGPSASHSQPMRILIVDNIGGQQLMTVILPIIEEYRNATTPANFIVRIDSVLGFVGTALEEQNMRTGEVLKVESIVVSDDNGGAASSFLQKQTSRSWLISRHPINAENEDWLVKKKEEAIGWEWEKQKRRIVLP